MKWCVSVKSTKCYTEMQIIVQICIELWKNRPKIVHFCKNIDFSQKKVSKNLQSI